MFATLYRGETISRKGNRIKVEICDSQYPGNTAPAVGELRFPADEPISIEWSSDKLDTIIGSTCTVTIVSPGDRTYIDLYQVEVGRIWLKLSYKAYGSNSWKTIWQGSLDTEFYEEPYSRNKDYDVTLTFSDFGMLQRLTYNLEGVQTLRSIITTALSLMSPQSIYTLNDSYISTYVPKDADYLRQHLLTEVQVRSDNFTDEDGETSNWYDVLEAILKPLALRIEQRAGTIYVYDINALINGNGPVADANHTTNQHGMISINPIATEEVYWSADDQMLSVDETANKVTVTFSQYAESKLFDGKKCETQTGYSITRNNAYGYQGGDINLYRSFNISFSNIANPPSVPGIVSYNNRRLYKIEPISDGPESSGVAVFIGGIDSSNISINEDGSWPFYDNRNFSYKIGTAPTVPTPMEGSLIYKTQRFAIPAEPSRYMRIVVPFLMDGKFNPFADEDSSHNHLAQDIKKYANAVYMRIDIKIYDAKTGGNLLGVYKNYPHRSRSVETGLTQINEANAGWMMTSNPLFSYTRPTLLEWCNINGDSVDSEDCGTLSTMNDNHEAFHFANKVNKTFAQSKGMYVPMPQPIDSEIWCEISIFDEIYIYDKGTPFPVELTGVKESVYKLFNWVLVGWPTIEFVKSTYNGDFVDIDAEDIEQSGIINTNAKDELSVSTTCGSAIEETARGAYLAGYSRVTRFKRGSRNDSCEQLLVGSIYSQYAGRHLKLTGSANTVVPTSGLKLLTDANTTGKKYLITEETYNVLTDESDIVLTEASGDNYTTA